MANHTLANYCIIALKAKGHPNLGDGNATSTTLSNCANDLWKSARVTVIRIEIFVVLTAISLLFMAAFGSWRRRSRNFFIQSGVLGAYTLSSSLVWYTLGLMHSSAVKSSLYPIWAASLYVLFGCVDSITTYSLDDNNQQTNQLFLLLLFQMYMWVLIGSDSILLKVYVVQLASFQFVQRIWAHNLASRSWNLNKMVADYMYEEHSGSGPSYDPISMKGYHYLVDWPLDEPKLQVDGMLYATGSTVDGSQVIDIERIWLCSGLSPEMKDVCLSFSLFNLLRRRFFGFPCAESSQPKTHDFVFKGLLSKNENGAIDYNRAFKVIDVELAFMYDFFFTKYAVLYHGSKKVSIIWSLASASLISVIAYQLATSSSNKNGSDSMHAETADVVTTVLILACIALLEFLQVLLYWSTIWAGVYFVCHYVRDQAVNLRGSSCTKHFLKICCMRFREIILTRIIGPCTSRSRKCYYQNKLGQYSLFESVSNKYKNKSRCRLRCSRFIKRNCGLLLAPDFGHLCTKNEDTIHARYIRQGYGKPAAVKLPAEVKKALVHSLQRTQGVLANGELSLVYNQVHDLLWACKHNMLSHSGISFYQSKENQTHIILTWHIATSYCEMATLKCLTPRVGGQLKLHLDVATILSKYCAYLVVSAPKLLPGHHYDTSLVFDAVAVEVARFLRKAKDKHQAMKCLPDESAEMSIFRKGVKLGRQLEEMEHDKRWKVLADFWAEMLLYVTPSDNVKEHIEFLANGGEFLTHLWALLTHAGILERDQRNVCDIENAETSDQPSPGQGSPYSSPCTTRAAPATCATNQSATSGNHTYCRPAVQPGTETMVQEQANSVQNVEEIIPNASTAPRPMIE